MQHLWVILENIPSMLSQTSTYSNRVFGLDLIRAGSILAVFVCHSNVLNPFYKEIPNLHLLGMGVEAFFVLSGFLIGRIILKTMFNPVVTFRAIWIFWVNRWLRTLPAYFFVLAICIIHAAYFGKKLWLYVFFSQNLLTPQHEFFPVSWSLAVEEWFYFTFPIILFSVFYLSTNIYCKYRIFFGATLSLIFFGIASKVILYALWQEGLVMSLINEGWLFPSWKTFALHGDWDNMRRMTVFRIDAIAYGCLTALWVEKYGDNNQKYYLPLFITGVVGFVISYWFLNNWVAAGKLNLFTDVFLLPLFCVSFAFMIPSASVYSIPNSNTFSKIITHISLTSYSFYLVHVLIISVLIHSSDKLTTGNGFLMQTTIFLATFAIIYLSSYLMYVFIESPFLRYRNSLQLKS